jgi:predicted nuclease of predicted toxin-antitoxin system
LDENLAARLVEALADLHPKSTHVAVAGLAAAADQAIWEYARERGFVIVTRDEDFHRLSVLRGPPPKVIGKLLDAGDPRSSSGPARRNRSFRRRPRSGFSRAGLRVV